MVIKTVRLPRRPTVRSSRRIKNGPTRNPPAMKATDCPTVAATRKAPVGPPESDTVRTDRPTKPSKSVTKAAARIVVPSADCSLRASLKTDSGTLILVAVSAAPTKTAELVSQPSTILKPAPSTNDSTSPTMPTRSPDRHADTRACGRECIPRRKSSAQRPMCPSS